MQRPSILIFVRSVAAALVLLAATVAARADELPALPLPTCTAPSLPALDNVVCEGARVTLLNAPAGFVGPSAAGVSLAISTRSVDFRLDADRGGQPQLVTFTLTLPAPTSEPGPDGKTYHSVLRNRWPDYMVDGGSTPGGVNCLKEDESGFRTECDGGPIPAGTPNAKAVLHREGACPDGTSSCTYRVVWRAYDATGATRTRQAAVYRVGFDYDVRVITELAGGGFDPACGSDLATTGCVAGGGAAYTAFRSDPPPELTPVAKAKRLGSRTYEFDGSASTPDVVEWTWQLSPSHVFPGPVLVHDFALDDPPITLSGSTALLQVKDKWLRTAITGVAYTLLAPGGMEGPLQIESFELVGVDENGVATLTAIVKNVSAEAISGVFLLGDAPFTAGVQAAPDGVAIDPGESVAFTVTFTFGISDTVTAKVQAFGTVPNGPVKSAEASKKVERESGPPPASTTVSAPSAAGETALQVTSNTGFEAGDYVVVNPGGATEEVRRVEALGSLIFAAPLAHPHAAGEIAAEVPPPLGDTTAPAIVVTSPPPGGSVCRDASLIAAFTCDDGAGVGVEDCGGATSSGQGIDTTTLGARQLVIDAWDANGNAASRTVSYSVVFCSSAVDAFRCYQAKPSKGTPKFAPITGVHVTHAFEDVLVDLTKPQLLCAPADTIGDGVLDPDTHLEAYALKAQKGQPKPVPQSGLAFQTQLGSFVVDVKKPAQLALPTAEDGAAPPPVVPTDVDRFACYPAKLAKGQPKLAKSLELGVGDQFTDPPKRVVVKKLARLCVPTGVAGGPANHAEHLLCFHVAPTKGRCAASAPQNAGGGCKKEVDCGGDKTTAFCAAQAKFAKLTGRRVANDLDAGTLDLGKEDVVCLPGAPAMP